jgi:hypothetical protein
MRGSRWGIVLLCLGLARPLTASAPTAPSFSAVEKIMARVETDWAELTPAQNPHAQSWFDLFNAIRADLKLYTTTDSADQRVAALTRLHKNAAALQPSTWPPAVELREELRHWLRPRVALSWAEYRILEKDSGADAAEREKWASFIEESLRPAVQQLEAASNVRARRDAVERVQESLSAIDSLGSPSTHDSSRTLQAALADLYAGPNLELSIDSSAISSLIGPDGIVEPGPVFFRNQWSYVTPGALRGIAFIPTPDGVQVSISQDFTSVTPIRGFQDQMEQDPRAKRATRMYSFSATTRNDAILTMTALFRMATGLHLAPGYQHGVSAAINSTPVRGQGLTRAFASFLGYSQKRITDEVYENAIGRMRDEVVSGSIELSSIRTSQNAARLNDQIRPYILDEKTIARDRFGVTDLRLQTLSSHAQATGNVMSAGGKYKVPARSPQPRISSSTEPGIAADFHLPAVLESMAGGIWESPEIQDIQNVVITREGVDAQGVNIERTERNVDFKTFLERVKEVKASGKIPRTVRLVRPEAPVAFAVDSAGRLVILFENLTIEIPAPAQAATASILTGPAAQVYRIEASQPELVVEIVVEPTAPGVAPRVLGKIVTLDPGPGLKVLAIDQDDSNTAPLNVVQARVVTTAFSTQLAGQTLPLPSEAFNRPGLFLRSVSPLDPSGWMRANLIPTQAAP